MVLIETVQGRLRRFGEGLRNMAVSTDEKWLYLADWSNNRVRSVEIQTKKVSTLQLTDAEGKPMSISEFR